MTKQLTLMTIHAHPDDEALYTGGVLAHYGAQGVRTVLVTCTRGEEGATAGDLLRIEEGGRRLSEVREEELHCSMKILGIHAFHQLGYRDSGLLGRPANDHLASFYQAEMSEAIKKLVTIVRRERPDVLISYDERGGYGHPDHIKAHQISVAAFRTASIPEAYAEAGAPWQPSKLYYIYSQPTLWPKIFASMRERGVSTPLDEPGFDPERYRHDPRARTVIQVTHLLERKLQAVQCHRTQRSVYRDFLNLPESLLKDFAGYECFLLVESHVGFTAEESIETDLFTGLR